MTHAFLRLFRREFWKFQNFKILNFFASSKLLESFSSPVFWH